MILIVTHKSDFTADFIINKLNQANIAYYRLNCEDLLDKKNSSIKFSPNPYTAINGIKEFKSVWFRRTKPPQLGQLEEKVRAYCLEEFQAFLHYLWRGIKAEKWLSYPEMIYRAENKVLQLEAATQTGFKVPKSLITGNPEEIIEFYEATNRNVIIKPLYFNRYIEDDKQSLIFTNKLSSHDLENIDQRIALPSIFQENIAKKLELRITVVGERVFAAAVNSQTDEQSKYDWRKKKLAFEKFDLPQEIALKCLELTKMLELNFGAIDMILSPNGDYTFLEINPNGQWVWIEKDSGLDISGAIVDFLS